MKISSKFQIDSERKAFDKQHRKTISFNMKQYNAAVSRGMNEYVDLDLAKERSSYLKEKVLNNWDQYLLEFETNFTNNGGEVYWAKDSKELIDQLIEILNEEESTSVVKSKSMTTEEVELNEHLEENNIEVVETDLGEFIVQVAGEKPYHIVTPAMHKSKEDVAELFCEKFNTPIESTPEELTAFVRDRLRRKFLDADVGITGANFILPDIGAVALTENEGNGLMTMAFPKIHIVIAGIEKLIPSYKDLTRFWPILATHGTGQKVTVYSSIITGPKKGDEKNGPERMIVFLLDNGRTELFAKDDQYSALKCIRCGSCLNACPVYKNIGGYTYNSTYSGPIGAIITPHLNGMKDFGHLSFASSLCGKCKDVCPVNIDIPQLLLFNRRDYVRQNSKKVENTIVKSAGYFLEKRKRLDLFPHGIKNISLGNMAKKVWGPRRSFPVFKESFSSQWKNKKIE
jgi:L-lactate dehydrogenase complex protein LldF